METNLKIISKNDILLNSLFLFYKENNNIENIIPIINGQSNISLRVLDWFVTNYSKKNNIVYNIEKISKPAIIFNVFLDYRLQLKAYSKKYFDPFCRKNRIIFYYQDKLAIKTTVGQLNFFRWALKNKIIEHVTNNLETIVTDMNTIYKERKLSESSYSSDNSDLNIIIESSDSSEKTSSDEKRQKRKQLSKSATKTLNRIETEIILNFD
jgi:hypothetical protein